jgi:apolipoprotein N-acyltransferase
LAVAAGTAATACSLAVYTQVSWPWWLLGWVGFVPWLAALDRVTSLRGAVAAGLLTCVAFSAAIFPWFPDGVVNYTGAPWPLALAVFLLVAPLLEPQALTFAVARFLASHASAPERWWLPAVAGAGVYVGTEWAFPKLLADTLGQGLFASPHLRQAADVFGAHGLTFVLLLGNECALAALRAKRLRAAVGPLLVLATLLLGLTIYGNVRLAQFRDDGSVRRVTAAVVQANISHYDRLKLEVGAFEAVRRIVETHFSLSAGLLRQHDVDLLVWPETIYPTTFGSPKSADGAAFDRAIGAFVEDVNVPLVFGSYDTDGSDEFNAAILLEPSADGQVSFDVYRKTQLFPFTEYLPAWFESERVRRWLPWAGTWKPGDGPHVLPLRLPDGRTLRIAPLICYDAVDPAFGIAAARQGAEILVTLSNDSWFAFPGVQHLILIVSAFRSIETRRPQIRATPTGISAVIDSSGELRETIDVDVAGTFVAAVTPVPQAQTLMLAWGNWFPPAALAFAVVCLVGAYRRSPLPPEAIDFLRNKASTSPASAVGGLISKDFFRTP